MTDTWRFAPATEADFEPLLAIRIDVMREHLERVFRYDPSRARRVFCEHFAEGAEILKVLLAEADALGLPCELDVLLGSPADRFYERHGFVKQGQDDIEANFRRPISRG